MEFEIRRKETQQLVELGKQMNLEGGEVTRPRPEGVSSDVMRKQVERDETATRGRDAVVWQRGGVIAI